MTNNGFISALWMFIVPLITVMLPVSLGQRYGLYIKKTKEKAQEAPIGAVVASGLGLLAFMLAFTFQIVGNRFDKRRELLLNEISDIRSAYLNSGLVPDPIRSGTKSLLMEYVDIRVNLYRDPRTFGQVKLRSEQILDSLWNYSERLAAEDRSSEAYSLFISSISNLVTLFNERITVELQAKLPPGILYTLGIVAFLTMFLLGVQFGISGKVSFLISFVHAFAFACVMWIILALDRPETGIIRLSPAALLTLQKQLHKR